MATREIDIEKIVDEVRDDLKDETRNALQQCTNKEIQGIIDVADAVTCLEIEHVFTVMVLHNRLDENSIPGWDVRNGMMYDVIKEKYMPGIRKDKIDKLIDG